MRTKVLYYVAKKGTDAFYSREVTRTTGDGETKYEFTDIDGFVRTVYNTKALLNDLSFDVVPGNDGWMVFDNADGIEAILSSISSIKHRSGLLESLINREYVHRRLSKETCPPDSSKDDVVDEIIDRVTLNMYTHNYYQNGELANILLEDIKILSKYIQDSQEVSI